VDKTFPRTVVWPGSRSESLSGEFWLVAVHEVKRVAEVRKNDGVKTGLGRRGNMATATSIICYSILLLTPL
jgi:hypothetical protein